MGFWTKTEGGLQSRTSGVSYEHDDEEQTQRREVCGVLPPLLLLRPAMSAATLATHAGAASHQGKAKQNTSNNRGGQIKQQSRGVETAISSKDGAAKQKSPGKRKRAIT